MYVRSVSVLFSRCDCSVQQYLLHAYYNFIYHLVISLSINNLLQCNVYKYHHKFDDQNSKTLASNNYND